MLNIKFTIEGNNAVEATKALLSIPGLSGDWQSVDEEQRGLSLATIATIVGIAAGTVAVAEQIRKWYREWKKGRSDKTIERAVMVLKTDSEEKRINLEGATLKDISEILEVLIK